MRLEIVSVAVKDIKIEKETRLSDGILSLDPFDLQRILLEDKRIASVSIDVARPGSPTRIVNLIDVIQPRCKTSLPRADFPGWLSKAVTTGEGRTVSLTGCTVAVCNRFSRRSYSGMMDMFGRSAHLSTYGSMVNLVLDPEPTGNVDERDFEIAARIAGLKAAVYLARAAEHYPAEATAIYDLDPAATNDNNLPRVAYCAMLYTPQHDYQGVSDPILYGGPATEMLPTIIHPNEILDGALVNALTIRGMDTYTLQNHAIIKELYGRHGRDLNFAGMVVYSATMDQGKRERNAAMAASLVRRVLKADGVILTKVHGGMPSVDQALVAEACEKAGVKTTLLAHLFNGASSLGENAELASLPSLNAVVNVGFTLERMHLEKGEKILGGSAATGIYCADFKQTAGDDVIDIEQFLIAGVHDHLGGSRIVAVDY